MSHVCQPSRDSKEGTTIKAVSPLCPIFGFDRGMPVVYYTFTTQLYLGERAFDVLPALEDGDSLDWRLTSQTENVMCSIDIPIMRDTTRATRPFSYPQCTQSTRPRPLQAGRASHTGEHLTTWDADTSKPDGFVVQLMPAHAPARIVGRFGEGGFDQLRTGHVPHSDEPGTPGDLRRDFVRPVLTAVADFGMQRLDALLFASPLRQRQGVFVLPRQVRSAVDHAIGAGDLLGQAQVNADFGVSGRLRAVCDLALQVDIPAATGVLGEAPGFDRPFDSTRQPQAKKPTTEANAVSVEVDGLIGKGYPAERAFAGTPGQATCAELPLPRDVLCADTLHSLGVETERFGCASNEGMQVIHRQETPVPAPSEHRHFIAVVPHRMNGVGHADEMLASGTVLDAVLKGDD